MTIQPPQPPVVQLYQVLSTDSVPPCRREPVTFGFHDVWPPDMEDGEFILIELSDGSSRIASNKAGHMMLLGQLFRLYEQRPELHFTAYRCRPIGVAA